MRTPRRQILPRIAPAPGICAILLTLFLPPLAPAAERITPDFAALAREAAVRLPPPPAWTPPAQPRTWTPDELAAEFGRFTDTPPAINMLRTRLLAPDTRWIGSFKDWFGAIQKPLAIRFEEQRWDCDDYANCFVAFADLLGLDSKSAGGALCVGWATVYYRRPFAGIRAGTAHAVVIIGATDGLYVLEPQDGTMVPLRNFPNRHTIEEITF